MSNSVIQSVNSDFKVELYKNKSKFISKSKYTFYVYKKMFIQWIKIRTLNSNDLEFISLEIYNLMKEKFNFSDSQIQKFKNDIMEKLNG